MAEIPPLAEIGLDRYAPYLMNRIMGRYNAALRARMAELGLTVPKMRALAVLSVRDALRVQDLATLAVVDASTLSRALDQLEAAGLVTRGPDPADSRATLLRISEAGRALFQTLWPHMGQAHDRLFHAIPEAERQAFLATLRKILTTQGD